ncbi:MAG: hypothetical protein U9Q37_04740 [Euryarchaeota archaeon]|nr:hypothetical protein [Euryarchaeota archaeon]
MIEKLSEISGNVIGYKTGVFGISRCGDKKTPETFNIFEIKFRKTTEDTE